MKRFPLYIQIITGLVLGIIWGVFANTSGIPASFSNDWIKPFGTIFIRLLKMIAVPLVFASLIVGISNLNDIRKLSRMGGKTVLIYLFTTLFALIIGVVSVNLLNPGEAISSETRMELLNMYSTAAGDKLTIGANSQAEMSKLGPLAPLVNMVPENIFSAASQNRSMLQIVFLAIFLGVATVMIPPHQKKYFIGFFENFNHILIKVIDIIMSVAPIGVFALIGAFVAQLSNFEILLALGKYCLTVILGLVLMLLLVYPVMLKIFTNVSILDFYKNIRPAQVLAFSTSSSCATLPVTMDNCEKNIGISNKVASFVLPLGATINMDGTSLYQAVAAIFICQVTGQDLSLAQQLTIIFTALLASIGTAGVPGVGIIMLTIVLGAIGVEEAYIALILGPDRILDMCRTVINVTGDATTATIIASSENEISI